MTPHSVAKGIKWDEMKSTWHRRRISSLLTPLQFPRSSVSLCEEEFKSYIHGYAPPPNSWCLGEVLFMAKCWGGDQRDLPVMTKSAVSWGVRREMLQCFQKCLVELQMGSSTTRPALAGGWKLKSKRSNSYYLCIIIFSCCFKYSLGSLVRKKKKPKILPIST